MTIEERAKKSGIENAGWNDTLRQGIEAGYIIGATDQRKIDIDNACEWIMDWFPSGCGAYTGEDIVDEFRKAMQED